MAEFAPLPLNANEQISWEAFAQHEKTLRLRWLSMVMGARAIKGSFTKQTAKQKIEKAKDSFVLFVQSQAEITKAAYYDNLDLSPEFARLHKEVESATAYAAYEDAVIDSAERQFANNNEPNEN